VPSPAAIHTLIGFFYGGHITSHANDSLYSSFQSAI